MHPQTRNASVLMMALLLGATAWWGMQPKREAPREGGSAVTVGASSPARAPGAFWDGAIQLTQRITLPGGAPVEIDLQAQVHGVDVAPALGEARRVWSLAAPTLRVAQAGQGSPAADAARADLSRTFGATYDARGRLVALYVSPDADVLAAGLREQIVSLLQVDEVHGEAWAGDELDPNGTARVRYARAGERLVRDREGYVSVVAGDLDAIAGTAHAEIRLGSDGWLDALRAEDALTRTLNADGVVASVAVSVRVDRMGAGVGEVARWDPAWVRVIPGQGLATEAARADLEARVLAGATLQDLLTTLRGAQGIDRARLARRIAALIRLDPSQIDTVRDAIPGLSADDAAIVMQGVAQSGVSGAQAAVANVLGADPRPEVRQAAAVELALAGVYDPAAVAGLQAATRDGDASVRDASHLAIGAQVRAGGDPALMSPVAEGFDPQGADALTRLRALGNSGVDATLDVALVALERGDAGVRRAALEALRHVEVPVDDALWAGLGDGEAEVRLAAVRAAEAAGGAALEGLADLA
ncbi:MAG: hypothetical protein RLZZ383_820, partial [Pseudomonadota bacterium]